MKLQDDLSSLPEYMVETTYQPPVLKGATEDLLFYDSVLAAHETGVRFDLHRTDSETPADQIEPALLSVLEAKLAAYEPPALTSRLKDPNSRWKVASALQKAIRRGEVPTALRMAHALIDGDGEYFWRRLPVIAMEDISLGDLYLVAQTVSISTKKKRRQDLGGDQKVGLFLVERLARALKCRFCPDATGPLDWTKTHGYVDELAWMVKQRSEELAKLALNRQAPFRTRGLALWLLGGTEKFKAQMLPLRPGKLELLKSTIAQMGHPPLLKFLFDRFCWTRGEVMTLMLVLGWEMLLASETVWHRGADIPDAPLVSGVPSYAYDRHTQDGKRAIAYFTKACDPVRAFFDARPKLDRVDVAGIAVFYAEGGVLDRQIDFDGLLELERWSMWETWSMFGLKPAEAEELMALVTDHRDKLDYARTRVTLKT